MSLRPRVGDVDQHPASLQPLGGHQVDQRLLLRVQPLLGQGRHLHDDLAAPGVEDRLPLRAAVGVGEEGLQVRREQPLGTLLERSRQLLLQLFEHLLLYALRWEKPVASFSAVHRGQEYLLFVVGQAGGHVRQSEEDGVVDDVEERRGHQPRPLPHHLAELLPSAVAPVLQRPVFVLADAVLLEPVPLDPPTLIGAPELRPDLRREAVQQVEDGRGVAAEQGPRQAEGLAAGVGEDARRDALGRAAPLKFVDLVSDQQVEEALHPVLHVVAERVAGRAGPVGLPER